MQVRVRPMKISCKSLRRCFPKLILFISGNTWYPHERVGCFGAARTLCLPHCSRTIIRLRYRWPGPSLAPCADAHDHRTLPCPAPCRARARVAPAPKRRRRAIALGTQAPSNFAGNARARANPVAARRRSISRDSSRATRPPAFLRRLHPETSRHRTREPRGHAAPSARRITTRRRLAGGVRRTGGQRPSVRGSISASVRGAISARVPPSSPSRHARSTRQPRHITLHSARTPPA